LSGAADDIVLELAALQGRILLTHDIETMTAFARDRLVAGKPLSGVILIRDTLAVGNVIEDLMIIAEASSPDDWANRIDYLPL